MSRSQGLREKALDAVMEVVALSVKTLPWPTKAFRLPTFQAHRGYRPTEEIRENTLEAFRLAKQAGAEMSECDVHLTRDLVAVVFHDSDLKRIVGRNDRVSELTAVEMKELTGAPTLFELLSDPSSPSLVNIELKTADVLESRGLEFAVLRAIHEAKAENRVMFSSFNPFALRRLSALAPDIPRALLVSDRPHKRNRLYLRKMWLGTWCKPHLLHLDDEMLTQERLTSFRDRGIKVVAWTVNDSQRAEQLLSFGARGVISDVLFAHPDRAPETLSN